MGVVRLVMVGMVAMVGMVGAEVQGSQDPPYLGSYQVSPVLSCPYFFLLKFLAFLLFLLLVKM